MKHLRMLNIDTDGSKSTITSSHTKTIDLSCFPALSSFWLSRTHGGYEAPVVSPVLSALNHLTDLYMTCSLDPIADALAVCGNTLRRLRIVTVIRGDPKSEEQRRASDKGLESLGKSLKSLVTFHLFLTPPDTNDDIYIPIVDNKIPITNRGVLALAKGCKDLKVLSLRAGRPLELSGITDECLEGLLDLKLSLTELRLDPVNINFTKLLSTPSGRNLKFPRLQVVEFGNHHENFATKEGMTLFIDRFCPRLASFRYNDGEYERDFCKAAETGLSFWYGWEDMDETGEEEEN
ncbi:hypothetical protein BC829DRAFT_15984 [Chytridium lagenaria]|nr:hypothetical protein BC829DRAFT_120646 [Chytridium lagenaria]KAI8841228.1 hypothetical protein BC829DRAFT_15984 [Chytridium lagenaria]